MSRLPKPTGKQKDVLYYPCDENYIVLGTAGSGKTTLAIHRAVHLATNACQENEKVLLVTFNRVLVTYLQSLYGSSIRNLEVRNYHTFAKGYLASRGKMGYYDILDNAERKRSLIKEAIANLKKSNNISTFARPAEEFYEEICWLQKMGLYKFENYYDITRIGRKSTRIKREDRQYFFEVFMEYIRLRQEMGFRYDWDDLAYYVCKEFENDSSERYYKHIVIDEGQDFSPMMLKSLTVAIPEDGTLMFLGDVAQQIYGSRISWRDAGIKSKEIIKFEDNYRNTREIANLAINMAKSKYYNETNDLLLPRQITASGAKPTVVKYDSKEKEIEEIVKLAKDSSKNQHVGILVRNWEQIRELINALRDTKVQILEREMKKWNDSPGITIGTYYSAKGLEFDFVILPNCDDCNFPDEDKLLIMDREEALSEEIKLLYVAVTRARKELLISHASQLTELFPNNSTLYTFV